MSESELMHFAVDISFSHTDLMWALAPAWRGYPYYGPDYYEDMARLAERGVLDLLFFGDAAETPENHGGSYHDAVRMGLRWPKHDMMPMVPIMARATKGLGFGLTMSTTYHHPFHVARLFSSLDWVTGGRTAWNSVTSSYKNEAANYGFDLMVEHDARYARAQEHMEVVTKLWDSVEADVLQLDHDRVEFADPDKVHLVNHRGEFYNVRGPLPALPSPQGRPIVVQAGQSAAGLALAGRFADLQFASRRTAQSIAEHRARLDAALEAAGRKPREVGVLWNIKVFVDESVAAAKRREQTWRDRLPPDIGSMYLSCMYGIDFSKIPGDLPLAELGDAIRAQNLYWGTFEEAVAVFDPAMTVEEWGRVTLGGSGPALYGSPADIVDQLEVLHDAGGRNGGFMLARGFEAMNDVRQFVEQVVPELQRRHLMKTRYAGPTLRENLA